MKSSVPLSNSNLLKLSGDLLGKSRSIRFKVKGFSMRPFIRDGDLVTVSPLRNSPVKVGDVVLYKTTDDQAVVHRVIRKTIRDSRKVFFIKGDAAAGLPEKVDTGRILGRITAVERNGRERKLDTKLHSTIGLFFAGLSPFSRWIYPLGSKLKLIGRRLPGIILEKLQGLTLYGFLTKKLMKENIYYKIAAPSDAYSISRLCMHEEQHDLANHSDSLKDQIKNPEESVYWLVAKRKDKVIGCVTLSEFQKKNHPYTGWWLFGMKVNWRYRRMGIGEKLTEMAADIAVKHGASEIKLLVFDDAKPANNLYRKSGFRQISIPELDKQLQKEAENSRLRIIMAKDIRFFKTENIH